ncbi:MAG: glycosyltransferase, partial [Rhizobium sp.]|nr:glycosyltransferase [Rhizobium sp.]
MPVYNPARDVLLRTVDSLLGQTEAADIVIVDDGSLQPVSEVLGSREGIIVLRLARNGGVTAPLNHGPEHNFRPGYE